MNRVSLEMEGRSNLSPLQPPPLQIQSDKGFNLDGKVSPSILLIIIILAIVFFISGLLHLLVRFLLKPPNTRDPDDFDNVTALQGQLQQLFHLHDSGVDQTFIDSLPVFLYKEIIGVKDPFDCAVCLCEFEADDKLRLLPKCSHAFHMDCIDTWLLSHSTCPLCRSSLIFDCPWNTAGDGCVLPPIPIVCVLQSGSDSSREIGSVPAAVAEKDSSSSLGLGIHGSNSRRLGDSEFGSSRRKSCEIFERNEVHSSASHQVANSATGDQKIVAIKLGKLRNVDGFVGEGSTGNNCCTSSNSNTQNSNVGVGGSRRCYSMGSFAYVLDESSSLQVPISNSVKMKKAANKKPLRPGHRSAISEYGSDSRREFNGVEAFATIDQLCSSDSNKNKGQGNARIDKRKDSFSISKIWLRGNDNNNKKDKASNSNPNAASSKRAVSSRFPAAQQSCCSSSAVATGVGKSGTVNWRSTDSVSGGTDQVEIEMEGLENGGGSDEETQSCYSLDSQVMPTSSSTRRTLHWLMSKQNKIVHSSFSSNV